MNFVDLVIQAPRAIIDGAERSATVSILGAQIAAIDTFGTPISATATYRLADDEVLLPGLVDTHVHVNEPGRTDWEGFDSATAAAAAAGVTTIVDMPLNSLPPTLTASALATKRAVAAGQCRVDTGFWGGVVPANLADLPDLLAAGVFGVKCFLQDSGVPEFPPLNSAELVAAMQILAAHDALLLVHAEDPGLLGQAAPASGREYGAFLRSRPDTAEAAAIDTVIAASAATGCRAHIVHLSSALGVQRVREAKAAGVRITAETCPHYLSLDAASIPDGCPQYKCCPPIRPLVDQDALWAGLLDGTIDIVVTDHSPSTPEMKLVDSGDLGRAWGGIAGLQFGFRATWTAARDRGIPLSQVVHWMATAPATLVGLGAKGRIAVGMDADLVVFAPEALHRVAVNEIRHRHPITPYLDRELRGLVRNCWLRGSALSDDVIAGKLITADHR